jgi:hypothetical protein
MPVSPHLHVSIPHVEKFSDLLVMRLPIDHPTILATIQGGLARRAVLELELEIR